MCFQIQLGICITTLERVCAFKSEWETNLIYLPRHEDMHVTRWHVAMVLPPPPGNGPKWKRYHPLEVAERVAEHNVLELGAAIAIKNRSEFY